MAFDAFRCLKKNPLLASIAASLLMSLFHVSLFVDAMFVTFVHESAHGIAAVFTGGSIGSFEVLEKIRK